MSSSREHAVSVALEKTERAFGVVALAASAGGLKAVSTILAGLPTDFAAAVIVLQHLSPDHPSSMAEILGRRTKLAVHEVVDGETIRPGKVHVAPPGSHLVIRDHLRLSLTHTALVHFVRPSADMLFDSLAEHCGKRTVAVVLTGTGQDGASSLETIKAHGGIVIAQDEESSEFFGMPGAAIATGRVDFVLPLDQIAPKLVRLMAEGQA